MRQVFHLILCAVYGIAPVTMALVFAPIDSFIEWFTVGLLLFVALIFWYQVIEQDRLVWKQWYSAYKKFTVKGWLLGKGIETTFFKSFQLVPNISLMREPRNFSYEFNLLIMLPCFGILVFSWERMRHYGKLHQAMKNGATIG